MFRNLYNNKAYSIITISGLAIGMAAFLVIFQHVSFELSYDTFHQDADRLYRIRNDRIYKDIHDKSAGCPPAVGPTLKQEFPEIVEFARLYNITYMSSDTIVSAAPEQTFNQGKVFFAEPAFLKIFSFPLVKGSPDTALEQPNTAVISQSSAQKYFGAEDPMGRTISVTSHYGTQDYKITGLFKNVPEKSHVKFELLLSYPTLVGLQNRAKHYWGWNAFNTYILLSPTADPAELEAKLPAFVEKHKNHGEDYKREYLLQPIKDIHLYSNLRWEPEVNGNAKTVYFLIIIAVFILVIAWVNHINLSTARSMLRAKEVGVRKVLGANCRQLIRQFILESAFLNVLAFMLALVIVKVSLPYFSGLTGKPLAFTSSLWSGAWLWLVGSIFVGAVLSAVYPAYVLASFSPVTVLKGKFSHLKRKVNLRKVLVLFQFAISIILIAVSVLVYRQLSFMRSQELGVNIDQTLVVKIPGFQRDFTRYKERFKRELYQYPFVKGVTVSSTVPGQEYSNVASGIRPFSSSPEQGKRCFFINVDENYFDFFGIKFLGGRKFSRDFGTEQEAIVLNEEAVKLFGYENPGKALNRKIILGGLGDQIRKTIGVIKNYHHKSLKDSLQPVIFSFSDTGNYISLKIDGENTGPIVSLVKEKWKQVFPGKPFEYFFLDEAFSNQYKPERQFGKVFGTFTLLAIFIACLGLFGLASFTSEQRTKEIGIRKVLGASAAGILGLLVKEFTRWVILANIFAWPLAYFFMDNWLRNFAYRVNIGFLIFIFSGAAALVIALLTVGYQAIRTAMTNPVETLRYE